MSQDQSTPEPTAAGAGASATVRPLYWSIRRELWESQSLYITPLVIAGLILFGFLLSRIGVAHVHMDGPALNAAQSQTAGDHASHIVAIAVLLAGLIVSIFYCLGALHNERRDRSVLFWKSLPVSDLTTVAAKTGIPLVVQPVIGFVIIVLAQLLILLISGVYVLAGGGGNAVLNTPLPRLWLMLLYCQATFTLWYAPIYTWCLLVSAWARRAPFLWAVIPPLAVCLLEKIALNTNYAAGLLKYRIVGGFYEALNVPAFANARAGDFSVLSPTRFFTSLGLWSGLAVSAAFLAAAVWLRRRREPI